MLFRQYKFRETQKHKKPYLVRYWISKRREEGSHIGDWIELIPETRSADIEEAVFNGSGVVEARKRRGATHEL
jgi:hypothetical protein